MNELEKKFARAATAPVSLTDLSGELDRIDVDMESGQITGVGDFGRRNDHLAKTKIIVVDKFAWGTDLSTKNCAVHWKNGKNSDVAALTALDMSREGKLLYKWPITNEYNQYAGNLEFSVHFFSIENDAFTYHISSDTGIGVVKNTMIASCSGSNAVLPSKMESLINLINDLASKKVNLSGWDPNMLLGTDEEGNVVEKDSASISGSVAEEYVGDGLKLDPVTKKLSVDTADDAEKDNTKPITSAAVFTEIGNIDALLQTL